MKKLSILIILLSMVLIPGGCKKEFAYKYQDKPKVIECPGVDSDLIHEALYSFQEDIANYYYEVDTQKGSNRYYINGLAQFVYVGFMGEADYVNIASEHSLEILERLKQQSGLFDRAGKYSNLNHQGEFVSCLFDQFYDEELRKQFLAFNKANYVNPKQLASPLRSKIHKAFTDANLATYIALEGYYQRMLDVDLSDVSD